MNGSRYTGYIKSDYVLRLCKNDPYGTLPAASSLYASPSLTSTVSGTLAAGAVVHVRGVLIQGDGTKWYGIQQGSGFVYLPSADITFEVSPNVNKQNTVTVPAAVPGLNARILCFRGDALTDKKLSKTLDLTGLAGDTYMVNAWGYGTPLPFSSEDRKFGVEVTFVHTDGTTSVKQAFFSPDLNDWQFLSEVFVAEKAYQSIKVAYVYSRNANLVFLDGLSLYREEFGQSYTYDADNNLISAVDNQKQRTEFAYDSSQDLTGVTDTKGNCFTYEYDDRHNVTQGTSA